MWENGKKDSIVILLKDYKDGEKNFLIVKYWENNLKVFYDIWMLKF